MFCARCWSFRHEAGSDRLGKNTLDAALWAEAVRRQVVSVGASKGSTLGDN